MSEIDLHCPCNPRDVKEDRTENRQRYKDKDTKTKAEKSNTKVGLLLYYSAIAMKHSIL